MGLGTGGCLSPSVQKLTPRAENQGFKKILPKGKREKGLLSFLPEIETPLLDFFSMIYL